MIYLPKKQKIFAVYNKYHWVFTISRRKKNDPKYASKTAKCGIFDLNDKKWTEIAGIKYQRKWVDQRKQYHYECCIDQSSM